MHLIAFPREDSSNLRLKAEECPQHTKNILHIFIEQFLFSVFFLVKGSKTQQVGDPFWETHLSKQRVEESGRACLPS